MDEVTTRIRELLESQEDDACTQAVEMIVSLGEPFLYSSLLRGCRIIEGTLRGNMVFPGGDWKHRMTATTVQNLLRLIAHAPQEATIHASLRRDAITALRIEVRHALEFPPDAARLHRLRNLSLQGNGLRTLPHSLTHLSRLTHLNLAQNQLEQLPEVVSQMTALQHLDLSFNPLTELHDDTCKLRALRQLILVSNALTELPDSMRELGQLHMLDLSRSRHLRHLPAVVYDIPNLRHLSVKSSRIRLRLDDVERLPALETLEVSRGLYRDPRHLRRQLQELRPGLITNL